MKKSVILAAVLTLFAATAAMAEHAADSHGAAAGHHLLVTDVPNQGQMEARVDYTYSYAKGKNELDEKITDEISSARATFAAGVAKGLKISASVPYTFAQHAEGTAIQGIGDLTLGVKYAPTKASLHLPVDLAVGLDWQAHTASSKDGKPGSGLNTYSPYVAVSKAMGMIVPYAKYQTDVLVKQDRNQTNQNLTVGAEFEFSHKVSLDAALKTTLNGSHTGIKSSTDVELELMPYINVCKNTYILPSVAYKIVGDIKDDAGTALRKDVKEFKTGLGLYVLF